MMKERLQKGKWKNVLKEKGPIRDQNYNPNRGYEPYWPGGDWVFDQYNLNTTPKEGTMCGQDCAEIYKNFGPVCGRSKTHDHKSFKNYCELQNEDCGGRQGWLLAYRGECREELKTYPTVHSLLITRADEYLKVFDERNPSTPSAMNR